MIILKIKMKEIWKDIKGYEGHYLISNKGRVKSLKNNTEKVIVGSIVLGLPYGFTL